MSDNKDKKSAKNSHQIADDSFKQTMDACPDAVFWIRSDGSIGYVNDTACDSLGYTREELLSMFVEDIDPDINPEELAPIWRDSKINEIIKGKSRHRRKDGSIFPVELHAKVLLLHGQIYHTVFVRDITEREKAIKTLQESENKFRTLIDVIPDFVWLKDTHGTFLHCNSSFANFLGTSESSIIGKTVYDFLEKEKADYFHDKDMKSIEEGKPTTNEELDVVRSTGEKIILLITKIPIRAPEGKIIGLLSIARDISDIKEADRKNSELEKQLYQVQKIESIGQLAGGIAHDFNNMLGVIQGHCELALLRGKDNNPIKSNLEEIKKAAKHSSELTKQLLTFARKQAINPLVIDLNEAIPSMLKMLQRIIGEQIQLSWSPDTNSWPIYADSSQIDQILANLCVNARDAIKGSGHIHIKTLNVLINEDPERITPYTIPTGDYVKLSVTDDGCGMSPETLSHIYEPFYTTKQIGQGTGLGLATVYGAVKQNGGFIEVESQVGKGTTFNIFFPRTNEKGISTQNNNVSFYRGNETILLVEDEKMLLDLEFSILSQCGYTVLKANTPHEAIDLAKSYPETIHILVTDVIMPEINGRELSEILAPIRPDMKVLYLSGYSADIITKQRIIPKDINLLRKPLSIYSFTSKVREVLNEK